MRLKNSYEPVEIKFEKPVKIKRVICGSRQSAFLTSKFIKDLTIIIDSGEVYMCGAGSQG